MRKQNPLPMSDYIPLSLLNDFTFCPYSIYLHNVYGSADQDLFYAVPQIRGGFAHETIDSKRVSTRKDVLLSLPVVSEKYCLTGKIDLYDVEQKKLIERKYRLSQVYQGQLYQLWGQFFCMQEMGYEIEKLAFYEISTHKTLPVSLPSSDDIAKFESFLDTFVRYDPSNNIAVSPNKCQHCVYCNLCDKTEEENVYS